MGSTELRSLNDLIKQKIHAGRLPVNNGSRVFSGRGGGYPCACCGRRIHSNQVEYELEISPLDARTLCVMHADCYEAWVAVLRNIGRELPVTASRSDGRSDELQWGYPCLADGTRLAI
jgi:hypothetical protein